MGPDAWLEALDRRWPRLTLAFLPTPLVFCPRLSDQLGVEIWMKRDDCTGLAMGGNKTRHLEYLLAAAQADGADVVVFGAAAQSNFARQLAAAAAQLGLDAHLVLGTAYGQPAEQGNVLLDRLFGAEIEWAPARLHELGPWVERAAARLAAAGRRPYLLRGPHADLLGAVSYVRAGLELDAQLAERRLTPATHYLAAAGPTQAGLVAAAALRQWSATIVGVAPTTVEFDVPRDVRAVASRILSDLGVTDPDLLPPVVSRSQYAGPSYGQPTPESVQAVRMVARGEGVLLDPVYTGKAMAALLADARVGTLRGPVVFWHTGGTPALFAFPDAFAG